MILADTEGLVAHRYTFGGPVERRRRLQGLRRAGRSRLSEGLPRQIVSEMCLTGNPVESERLYALGLVNAVVPAGEVLESAKKMASKLAAGAVGAMGIIKSEIAAAPIDVVGGRRPHDSLQRLCL